MVQWVLKYWIIKQNNTEWWVWSVCFPHCGVVVKIVKTDYTQFYSHHLLFIIIISSLNESRRYVNCRSVMKIWSVWWPGMCPSVSRHEQLSDSVTVDEQGNLDSLSVSWRLTHDICYQHLQNTDISSLEFWLIRFVDTVDINSKIFDISTDLAESGHHRTTLTFFTRE